MDALGIVFINRFYSLCRNKVNTLIVFVGVLLLSNVVLQNNFVRKSFMPQIESDNIRLVVTLPPNTPVNEVMALAQVNDGQKELLEYVDGLDKGPLVKHFYNSVWGTRVTSTMKLVALMIVPSQFNKLPVNQVLIDDIPDEDIEFKSTMNVKEPRSALQ